LKHKLDDTINFWKSWHEFLGQEREKREEKKKKFIGFQLDLFREHTLHHHEEDDSLFLTL
jgi:hypothetical protein